jgi:hypothetical protein
MPRNDQTRFSELHVATDAAAQRRAQLEIFSRLDAAHAARSGHGQMLFAPADITAGTENELAAAVNGTRRDADLPRAITRLPFYQNGGLTRSALDQWLTDNRDAVWEHSWLRIGRDTLGGGARVLLALEVAGRSDRADFESNAAELRVPASYLLRLALADVLGAERLLPGRVLTTGRRVLDCFLNDNTAPEIVSTHIVSGAAGLGRAVARENAQRFLLTQLLVAYANDKFRLRERGQELSVYPAPNPPARLRRLSRLLPADAYRDLLMNPCLAGFSDGVAKRSYMHLCHETLSRSRVHANAHLVESGIARPWVVQSLVCDTSLLNNGTHLSLGSCQLGDYLAAQPSTVAVSEEKYLGDLASKIIEHFLPLFVGLYSAAPWRMAPAEFKPERALGFLPHELHATHLCQLWAAWKRKAGLLAGLKGDVVPDQRLLDYFAALAGTPAQPGFDGQPGNAERLKATLELRNVFSGKMTFYALYRLRELARMGFTGFEGRHYSLFGSLQDDLGPAAELQACVTAYAYRVMAAGSVTHAQIPDDPETESERRQIFFAGAIGLPSFYVRRSTRNAFLRRVLTHTRHTRPSKRHSDCLKVYLDDYRAALARMLAEDATLAEVNAPALADLGARLSAPDERGVGARLTRAVLEKLGVTSAMDVDAATFNQAAERYYRDDLRRSWMEEGLATLREDLRRIALRAQQGGEPPLLWSLARLTGGRDVEAFLTEAAHDVRAGTASVETLRAMIGLVLLNIDEEGRRAARAA